MTDLFSVKDKTVVITGGSGYLGSEWCRVFEEEGAKVVNWDKENGVDVTNRDDLLYANLALEKVDVLICGAAQNAPYNTHYSTYPSHNFDSELINNVLGVQNTIQTVAGHMVAQDSGSIILVSSELALIGPNINLYPHDHYCFFFLTRKIISA